MATKIRPLSPDLERALGFHFLYRFFQGEHIAGIARDTHMSRGKVRKLMKKAAATMIDAAQHTLLAEVFPVMVKVIHAALDQQLRAATDGKQVDTAFAERLLKGLFITDAPQLKAELVREAEGPTSTEVETLEGFVARRVLSPKPPLVIDAERA